MTDEVVHGRVAGREPTYAAELLELLRILLVTGLCVGIVVVGLGSRLAMFLLRVTSPDHVVGVTSDDGFTIGQVTLAGTYNLVTLGAVVGFIGAVAYVAVSPWLIGPGWFRRITVGLTAGALGGALLIHADGIDFNLLEPRWLAVLLFIVLPLVTGVSLAAVADSVADPDSWTSRGRLRWALPLVLLALAPLSLALITPVAMVVAVLLVLRRALLERLRASTVATLGVRSTFLVIPVLSFLALGQDLAELF